MNYANTNQHLVYQREPQELAITNAKIVTENEVTDGSLLLRDGLIADLTSTPTSVANALDWDGDFLLPGLVELHTDNLERHAKPRPGVHWPTSAAIIAHDNELVGAGITTVFDALRLGEMQEDADLENRALEIAHTIETLGRMGNLKATHYLHLRCELSCDNTIERLHQFKDSVLLRLISLMDHTPGQRQFTNLDRYREYYGGKMGLNGDQLEAFMREAKAAQTRNSDRHRIDAVRIAKKWNVNLASHDDANAVHAAEAAADGAVIAEFPTTLEAARACRRFNIKVMAGAPNVVRGKSHSGNISALSLAQDDSLDIFSSDYVPYSLLQAPFLLRRMIDGYDLATAVATVTRNPAEAVGLSDRGRIAIGLKGDLIRVHHKDSVVCAREVYRAGRRIG